MNILRRYSDSRITSIARGTWIGCGPSCHRGRWSCWIAATFLFDDRTYAATDGIAVYHERWEIELGDDELNAERLEQRESLRSKSVSAVEQAAWGDGVHPRRLRFVMLAEQQRTDAAPGGPVGLPLGLGAFVGGILFLSIYLLLESFRDHCAVTSNRDEHERKQETKQGHGRNSSL